MTITLIEWINGELQSRDWTAMDLSRRSGISQTHISKVMNEQRKPGNDFLLGIARAFDYPALSIFQMAGVLPVNKKDDPVINRMVYLLGKFPEDEKKNLLTYMQIKLEMLRKEGRITDDE